MSLSTPISHRERVMTAHSLRLINPFGIQARRRPYVSLKPQQDDFDDIALNTLPTLQARPVSAIPYQKLGVDIESVPTCISLAANRDYSSVNFHFMALPPLPPLHSPDFERILCKKLEICSEILNFSSQRIHQQEKETKTSALIEFIDLFDNTREIRHMNPKYQRAIFIMLEKNIFRADPIFPSKQVTLDYTLTVIEPSWPHLFYCYLLLIRFAQVFTKAEFINIGVASRALNLMQLPDFNERNQLVSFLKVYYDTHVKEQDLLINLIGNMLQSMMDGSANPFCGMPLTLLLVHIITRAREMTPLLADTILHSFVPIIGLPYLYLYHLNVRQLISALLSNFPDFSIPFLKEFQKIWPQSNGTKQNQYLEVLIFIFSKMQQTDFKPISKAAFAFLGECVLSNQCKISETVLDLWNKNPVDEWLQTNSRMAILQMFEAVSKATESHWCKVNQDKAVSALQIMAQVNKRQYHKMKVQQKQNEQAIFVRTKSHYAYKRWIYISKKASRGGWDGILQDKLDEVEQVFKVENLSEKSRFLPLPSNPDTKKKPNL